MIAHDSITLTSPDAPVVFASLAGLTCSICAPDSMSAAHIEAFANRHGPPPSVGHWVVVDKSKYALGEPTPNLCNQVAGRLHWFLLNHLNAMRMPHND